MRGQCINQTSDHWINSWTFQNITGLKCLVRYRSTLISSNQARACVLPFDENKSLWNLVKSIFTIWFVKWLSTKKQTSKTRLDSTIDLLIPTDQVMCKHSIKIIKWIHFNWIELHVGVESIQFKSIQFDCSRNDTHGIQSTLVDLILFVFFCICWDFCRQFNRKYFLTEHVFWNDKFIRICHLFTWLRASFDILDIYISFLMKRTWKFQYISLYWHQRTVCMLLLFFFKTNLPIWFSCNFIV